MARIVQVDKYVIITLGDDGALRVLVVQVVRSDESLCKVFACRIRRESGAGSSGQNSVAKNYQPNYEPYTSSISMPIPEPEPEIYNNSPQSPHYISPRVQSPHFIPLISVYGGPSSLPGPKQNSHPRPPQVQEDPNESKFEFINEVSGENMQTVNECGERDRDIDDEGDEEEYSQFTVRQNRENMSLSGRSETHPFVNFNDTSVFREAGVSYYDHQIEYKSELAKGQYFTNKKQLTKKIREYHVDKNKKTYTKRSNTSRLEIRCNTLGCCFKLKARAINHGDTWMITEQDTPHTCTFEYTRIDHTQLTASIIADIIETSIKDIIWSMAHCVRVRFGNITPKCN